MDWSDDCLSAFKNNDYDEAFRLLPLLVEQVEKVRMEIHPHQRFSLGTMLSKYTTSINPQENDNAGLLHLSSRNGWLDITRKLIEQYELDPRVRDSAGNTCLHYAAAGNQLEIVKYLISRFQRMRYEVSLHTRNKYGATPSHIAAANGSLDVIKYLIEQHHYNTENIDNSCETVLHYAVQNNSLAVVEYLVLTGKCDPILAANEYGNTVLLFSAANGSLDTIKYLIHNRNCDLMVTNEDGDTVLHYAAENIDIVKYLITKCNCNPMVTNKYGRTVLHYAVQDNHLAAVEYLVLTGKFDPILAANKHGNTVLLFAATKGLLDTVKYLIHNCKCNPMVTHVFGKTVLHYAVEQNQLAVVEYLVSTGKCDAILAAKKYGKTVLLFAATNGLLDTVKYLIHNCKYDPMVTDVFGKTVLHYAVEHINIVKYLITECNCNPMVTDEDGKTVFHYAVQEKQLDVVKYLVSTNPMDTDKNTFLHLEAKTGSIDIVKRLIADHNYDPNASNRFGKTVLHCAFEHINIVKYLITECNCNPMDTDKDGKTVLHYAVQREYLAVVEYLVLTGKCDPILAANKYGNTVLLFAVTNGLLDTMKYLVHNHKCDPMVTDKDGKTLLHCAVEMNQLDVAEYLLSTGKCNPVAKDNKKRTPLQLTNDDNRQKVRTLFIKFGQVATSHPVDSYVNVLLLGNPGAGKSTLSHVIIDTATGSIVLGSLRKVKGVEPCTAGIIPYKLQHKTLGNVILHDFAGHSEYYSSHSAVIENLLQGSAGVFMIVVNILEKEVIKQLYQWLTVVRNEEQKALDQCHAIVVVSHVDEISNPVERKKRKEEIQQIIGRERCCSAFLDCRKLGGNVVDSLFNKLSSACESIRSTSGRNLSLYCHMMYGLLEERKENMLTLSDVMSAAKDNDIYVLPDKREEVLDVLHSLDSIGLIKVLKSEDKVWVVVNKGILLSEVDGILFAPETFKEHVDIASNTGIVSVSGLTRLFPHYNPDMLICFLKNMELCQEMNPFFLRMTNLHQLTVGESEEGEMERRGERLLFFPCLLYSDRPDEMTSQVYQFGWCLQCTGEHHFFPPRYFHVLSLHLAYKLALPQDETLSRRCTFWKNGLYWLNGYGVGVLVEIVDESQCVLVLMSCEEGYNMVELRREVIGKVLSVYKESCPSLEVKELVIDPKELNYHPVNTPRERTVYSARDVMLAIDEGRPFTVSDTGIKRREVKSILPDESLADINNLSLLGGRDIKV